MVRPQAACSGQFRQTGPTLQALSESFAGPSGAPVLDRVDTAHFH